MGTPDFSVPCLRALFTEHDVVAVFTQPDKPKGRGQKMQSSPVKEVALEKGIPVYQPKSIRKESEIIEAIRDIKPEVIVVVAFGQILPKEVLDIPKHGCINVHASLLPELRGAAPINWAIIRGYRKSGVTTMLMNEGLDTGDMLLKEEVEIGDDETAEDLHDKLMNIGANLLIRTLDGLKNKKILTQKQEDNLSTYAPMLNKELGHINWKQDCINVYNLIRGVTPWPGAFCYYDKRVLKIWKADKILGGCNENPGEIIDVSKNGIVVACGNGNIIIKELQEVGSKRMDIFSYLNGHNITKGIKLK